MLRSRPTLNTDALLQEILAGQPRWLPSWEVPTLGRTATARDVDPYSPLSCALYRLRSIEEALLYVGIAGDPRARFKQHAVDKDWWHAVWEWSVEWFPNRETAEAAEKSAIETERPMFNSAYAVPRLGLGVRDHTLVEHCRFELTGYSASIFVLNRGFIARAHRQAFPYRDVPNRYPLNVYEDVYQLLAESASKRVRKQHSRFVERWNDAMLARHMDKARQATLEAIREDADKYATQQKEARDREAARRTAARRAEKVTAQPQPPKQKARR